LHCGLCLPDLKIIQAGEKILYFLCGYFLPQSTLRVTQRAQSCAGGQKNLYSLCGYNFTAKGIQRMRAIKNTATIWKAAAIL